MNNLLVLKDIDEIEINPILLSIHEFEKLWKRDKTKDKRKARKELVYIYGMLSNEEDNIWIYYTDLKTRENVIIQDLFGKDSDWRPDKLVIDAMDKYRQRYPKTPSETLLETLQSSMMKIKRYIDSIDFNERDNNGRPVHDPGKILDTAKKAIDTYDKIEDALEKIRARKKLSANQIRGGAEISTFENEENFKDFFD